MKKFFEEQVRYYREMFRQNLEANRVLFYQIKRAWAR